MPDYPLMQSRLSRSVRLSIAMTEQIRANYLMREEKRKNRASRSAAGSSGSRPPRPWSRRPRRSMRAEDVEHVRAMVQETLVEDEILDARLDSLSPEEFVREVCRKIDRPPNQGWLPRRWADIADTGAGDPVPGSSARIGCHRPPAAAGWAVRRMTPSAGRPMPKPSIPDSS